MLNLLEIEPGQRIRLRDGDTAEVIENVGDGLRLNARRPDGAEGTGFLVRTLSAWQRVNRYDTGRLRRSRAAE